MIISDTKITQINATFKKFLARYFDYDIMKNVSNCNDLYEESQNSKRNERANKLSDKLFKTLNILICWRQNNTNKKIFSEQEKLSIIRAEQAVVESKLFKIYITKSQKM